VQGRVGRTTLLRKLVGILLCWLSVIIQGRGIGVGRGLGVALGLGVGVGLGVDVGVAEMVGVGVGLTGGVTVGVAVALGVALAVGVAVAVGVGVGVPTGAPLAFLRSTIALCSPLGGSPIAAATSSRPSPLKSAMVPS
jgi:hypothetical protein